MKPFLGWCSLLIALPARAADPTATTDAVVGRTVCVEFDRPMTYNFPPREFHKSVSLRAGGRLLPPAKWSSTILDGSTLLVSLGEALPTGDAVVSVSAGAMKAADGTPSAAVEVPIRRLALVPGVTTFAHPGLLHTAEELEFVRRKVSDRAEPWLSGWQKLRDWPGASLSHNPAPAELLVTTRDRGKWPYTDIERDCAAAHAHALQWAVTRDEAHAKKAVEILNAWSGKLTAVTGPDRALRSGLYGYQFVNAAEIVKHTYPGWPVDEQRRFVTMLDDVFWPNVKDGGSDYSNWDCGTILTGMCIGVFEDDPAKFNYALNRLAAHIPKYVWKSGQCNETARDHYHTQFGIGLLAMGCEVAWHQGVDAYKLWDDRVAAGFEYTAAVVLGKPVAVVPWARFPDSTAPVTRGKDSPYPVYELVLNHYQTRRGRPMPNTAAVVAKRRPEGYNRDVFGFGTLHHSGMKLPGDDAPRR